VESHLVNIFQTTGYKCSRSKRITVYNICSITHMLLYSRDLSPMHERIAQRVFVIRLNSKAPITSKEGIM
jgi:hypothetical protein